MGIKIYDTTLRDGMQGEKVSFSLEEKINVAKKLDELGIHYIEGGFPLANKKEEAFFKEAAKISFQNATVASFGSTRRPGSKAEYDPHIKALLSAETKAVTIVGKSWDAHVKKVIKTDLDENLKMIEDSVKFLKKQGREVIFDAEHYFDGYAENPEYALKTVKVAIESGADIAVLCDTNGGTVYEPFVTAVKAVEKNGAPYGVHIHNDTGMAVANSLISLSFGCTHIQGTINGWGERCGNANLCTIIPNLHYKTDYNVFSDKQLEKMTSVSRYISESANIIPDERQPYVGLSAFAHKAGQHADVILKESKLMEHMPADKVGNTRRILLSELAGKSTVVHKLKKFGDFDKNSNQVEEVTRELKEKESLGYEYEAAEASFDLLILKKLNRYQPLFELLHYETEIFKSGFDNTKNLARIRLMIENRIATGNATADGPVGALDKALRDAVSKRYPFINKIKLIDYKVRVLNSNLAAEAGVRVFIKSTDRQHEWETVGVSQNIIEASWQALRDSIEYYFNIVMNSGHQ